MELTGTAAICTFVGVELVTTLTPAKASGSPGRLSFWLWSERLKSASPKRLVWDCKGVVSCLHALRAGRRQPKGPVKAGTRIWRAEPWLRFRLGFKSCGCKPTRRTKVLMKGVWSVPICKVTAWLMLRPTKVPVNVCPSKLPKSGSSGALFVRQSVIFSG
eukprot:1437218-Amphidinium_carterae.1